MRSIDIGPTDLETVRRLLHEHAPGLEVRVFGSRLSWTARGTSDLDLALMTNEPLDIGRMTALKAAFTESNLPFRVDIVDWASTSESFRKVIEEESVVLYERNKRKHVVENEWFSTSLGELCDFRSGSVFTPAFQGRAAGDYPFIKVSDMNLSANAICIQDANNWVSKGDLRELKARILPGDAVVFAKIGEALRQNRRRRLSGKTIIDNNMMGVVPRLERVNPLFFYYALSQFDFSEISQGTALPYLTISTLSGLSLKVPPLPEQRAIAHILGTLDDKIELNRRMNETLEAMARALFKSWFVDFDPVRAKLEGRDTGLPNNIADLFPDQMVESELGEIPEGWEVGCLADIAVAPRRGIDPTDLRGETPYIGLEHMPRRSIALTDWEGTGKVTSNKSFFEKGEFLFGKLRPYFHKVGIAPISGVCSTDIVVIAPRSAIWSAFLLATISSVAFVNYTDQTSTGTKMPRTSWKTMSRYAMCLPTDTGARAFQKAMGPILARTVANIHENRTLPVLRETLLPKLISGEIRARHTKAQQLIGHT